MSIHPHLPQEIYDLIIDLLHDQPETLKQCCLVSASWISRARKHLFAHIEITQERDLWKWTNRFPDPTNSPAQHAHTLSVDGAFGEEDERSWIHPFSRVERLILECGYLGLDVGYHLLPFRILAHSLKSLHVNSIVGTPHSQVFGLIRSLPLLEDLTLRGNDMTVNNQGSDGPPTVLPPSTSPALTGTLELSLEFMEKSLRLLLNLPGGLHFRKLRLDSWRNDETFSLVGQLVAACSDTLECLDIAFKDDGKCPPGPINLSTLKKLKDVTIRCESFKTGWVIATLKSIGSEHLQQISIRFPYLLDPRGDRLIFEEVGTLTAGVGWSDLDRLLVRFSESRTIRSSLSWPRAKHGMRKAKDWVEYLMPESSRRGVVDLIDLS